MRYGGVVYIPACVILLRHYRPNSTHTQCTRTRRHHETETVKLYKAKLDEYYGLNKREGRAYGAYAVATTLLPNLVIALVLYYGGQLVLANDGMTSGKLVSFLLLLSSLSDAFNNMVRPSTSLYLSYVQHHRADLTQTMPTPTNTYRAPSSAL